jgi:hypothetical protein
MGSKRHPVSHHGMTPATIPGAIAKKSALPSIAEDLRILVLQIGEFRRRVSLNIYAKQ